MSLCQNLYESIKNEPFKIPEDDGNDLTHTFFNPDREGWLLKLGECRQQGRAGCRQGAMPLGFPRFSCWPGSLEREEAAETGTAFTGEASVHPALHLGWAAGADSELMRPCRAAGWVSWGILPLGWASPWGAELVSEHRDLEALQVTEPQQDVSEQAPGSCPRLRPPSIPQTSPCLTFPRHYHLCIPAPHAGSMHGIPAAPPGSTAGALRALAPVASLLGTSGETSARV